jgi:hypothetical protein
MPATAIAHSLPFVNWTLLLTLALGAHAAVVGGRLLTEATRGYLAFIAACATLLGGLAWLADGALPVPAGMAIRPDPALDGPRTALLGAFVLLAAATFVAVAAGRRAAPIGLAGIACGAGAAIVAAIGWSGGLAAGIPAAVQLLVLAGATGGALAAMVLGHWYLVTPHLPEAALVLGARALTAIVALQVILFLVWTATGVGTDRPFGALVGSAAVFVWLRLTIGLLFPLVVSWMAVRTARTRSMESATGLLYIDTAAVMAGTIVAAGLWFGAGLLV